MPPIARTPMSSYNEPLPHTSNVAQPTVFLVDFDDTLLPSTWLSSLKGTSVSASEVSQALFALEHNVLCLLNRLILLGTVCIITNAQNGWVELACSKFLPNVLPLLSKTKIVSARSKYEHLHPNDPAMWKLAAFREELGLDEMEDFSMNIISLGDSVFERDAMRCISAELKSIPTATTLIKTIKLMDKPNVKELISQLEILAGCMTDVVSHFDHLDLCLAPQQQQQQCL